MAPYIKDFIPSNIEGKLLYIRQNEQNVLKPKLWAFKQV